MENRKLWEQYAGWKQDCRLVDLTRELSTETDHWSGFPAMEVEVPYDYPVGFFVHKYSLVSQYGTHVDAPSHFVQGKRTLDKIAPEEMVLPLCVIDVSEKVAANPDFVFGVADITAWEEKYGRIPEGSFVAMRTDWSKRADMDNVGADGVKHFPGWGMDALKFLIEERNIIAFGHEPKDTDAGIESAKNGYAGEYYLLEQERYQIEMMCNLDKVPAVGALIFCGFPKVKDSPGFTARCLALCPKE